jgi:hypothetical protein
MAENPSTRPPATKDLFNKARLHHKRERQVNQQQHNTFLTPKGKGIETVIGSVSSSSSIVVLFFVAVHDSVVVLV